MEYAPPWKALFVNYPGVVHTPAGTGFDFARVAFVPAPNPVIRVYLAAVFISGTYVGNILIGMAGRRVDRPISPVAGETRTPFLPTQLLATAALGRSPLSLAIRDTAIGRSEIGFQADITGMA